MNKQNDTIERMDRRGVRMVALLQSTQQKKSLPSRCCRRRRRIIIEIKIEQST